MGNVGILGFAEPFSSWTHLLSAAGFLLAGIGLVAKGKGSMPRVISLVVYTFSLVFLFSMSGVYHLLEPGGVAREVLRRLDHAGIWVLIAGSFTPIHVILFRGAWRWLILLVVWTIAINGLVLEVIFFKSFPEWLILSLFLGLGWMGALTGYRFRASFHGESLRLLVGGGMFYSVGALFDFTGWPVLWPGVIGGHEIFHVFVVAGAYCHWKFIYEWADHPVANTIVFHVRIFPNQVVAEAISDHLRIEATDMEELKTMIRDRVTDKYHESIQPRIHLKYFQEETL
jgi:channel protein (hemolysin III family)